MATIRERSAQLPARPSIACVEWIDPLMMAGHCVPELVDAAGGANLFGTAGQHSGYLEPAQLAATDPDVIAIMPCGFDIDRARREIPALTARPERAGLSAVARGRVFITDGNRNFNRPGPQMVESAEILAELLHPGTFDFGHEGSGWAPP